MEKDDRIISRVKRLLAMSDDVGSPNEAMIALKRARYLMDKHNLKHEDMLAETNATFGYTEIPTETRNQKLWQALISGACSTLNDCIEDSVLKNGRRIYEFWGYSHDVQTCEFMFAYLLQAAERFYKLDKTKEGLVGVAAKNAYMLGFADKIWDRVHDIMDQRKKIKTSTGKELVLVKKNVVEKRFGVQKWVKVDADGLAKDRKAFETGIIAGEKAHLGDFLNETQQETLRL